MTTNKTIFILVLTLFFTSIGYSQKKIQVVTRTISKSFEVQSDYNLNIIAEKATIIINPSQDKTLRIKLYLISKNPIKEKAESDLKYCVSNIKEDKNVVSISNTFNTETNKYNEISSNLSAKYEIEIPSEIVIKVRNIYGDIAINHINNRLDVTIDFGQLYLSRFSGNIYILSNYSDIKANYLNAPCIIKAKNSDINLTDIYKSLDITSQFGNIKLDNLKSSARIESEMTAINILLGNPSEFQFAVTAIDCDLEVPDEYKKLVFKKSGNNYFVDQHEGAQIKIINKYSSISIKRK